MKKIMKKYLKHLVKFESYEDNECEKCEGKGSMLDDCIACGGSGDDNGHNQSCHLCMGQGFRIVECDECEGSGKKGNLLQKTIKAFKETNPLNPIKTIFDENNKLYRRD